MIVFNNEIIKLILIKLPCESRLRLYHIDFGFGLQCAEKHAILGVRLSQNACHIFNPLSKPLLIKSDSLTWLIIGAIK